MEFKIGDVVTLKTFVNDDKIKINSAIALYQLEFIGIVKNINNSPFESAPILELEVIKSDIYMKNSFTELYSTQCSKITFVATDSISIPYVKKLREDIYNSSKLFELDIAGDVRRKRCVTCDDIVNRNYLKDTFSTKMNSDANVISTYLTTEDLNKISKVKINGVNISTQKDGLSNMGENTCEGFSFSVQLKKSIPTIKKYIVDENNKIVTVYFNDNTQYSVKCTAGDEFDLEIGIEKCILKKVCGKGFKSDIKRVIKAQNDREKAEKLAKEKAIEEAARLQAKKKKNLEKRMRLKARYEARYETILAEEKAKLNKTKVLNEKVK